MMGMLMSVMITSYFVDASLRRPSTPSSASVTRRFFTRASAKTRSCRIIGESSTIRHEYSAISLILQIEEDPDPGHLLARVDEQAGVDERGGGLGAEEPEELGVDAGP